MIGKSIKFPFEESKDGSFLATTNDSYAAIKSHLSFFILTRRGSRLFKPSFGTLLSENLFEPMDKNTIDKITQDLIESVKLNIKGVDINDVSFNVNSEEFLVSIQVKYSVNDGIFKQSDILSIEF